MRRASKDRSCGSRGDGGIRHREDGPLFQVHGSVKRFRKPTQVMRRGQDSSSAAGMFEQNLVDHVTRGLINGVERFIEQEQAGILDQGSGKQHTLLLATRKLADLATSQAIQPQSFQRLADAVVILLARPTKPAQVDVPTRHHQVDNTERKLPIQVCTLGQVSGAMMASTDRVPIEFDCSGLGMKQPGDGFQQRALARPVGSHQSHPLAARDFQRESHEGGPHGTGIRDLELVESNGRVVGTGITVPATTIWPPRLPMRTSDQRSASTIVRTLKRIIPG